MRDVGSKTTFAFGDPTRSGASRWPGRAVGQGFSHPALPAVAESPWQPWPLRLAFGNPRLSFGGTDHRVQDASSDPGAEKLQPDRPEGDGRFRSGS